MVKPTVPAPATLLPYTSTPWALAPLVATLPPLMVPWLLPVPLFCTTNPLLPAPDVAMAPPVIVTRPVAVLLVLATVLYAP